MFFRDEQAGAAANGPLSWLRQLFLSAGKLHRFARWRCFFGRDHAPLFRKIRPESDGAPPDGNCAEEQEKRRRPKHDALMMCTQPLHSKT